MDLERMSSSFRMEAGNLYGKIDAAIYDFVFGLFRKFDVELSPSPITKGLPCVDSPTPVILGVSTYLAIVIFGSCMLKWKGTGKPRASDPRPLRFLVVLHNLFLFFLSLYMCLGIVYEAIKNNYHIWGNPYVPSQVQMGRLIYIFYMSKYFEFVDTIIMLLKKNLRQVSVLHVYHHSSIALIWWVVSYHAPGGEAYFSAALNSGVHVAMYLYYLLAALIGKDEKIRKKYLFWGQYLTITQMVQFAMNLIQAYVGVKSNVDYPQFLLKILYYYMMTLLVLFANFYVRKYIFPKQKPDRIQSKKQQ
ncbi:hypothetical protein CBR_g924 [Chara braunii]|uniref:Very-long-chain 3-oxoacyl-CoA synthase n=1 Tax=Chara braunii TaxID=69332 RepID=A0A388KCL7_CHABU|nr:hypothetical protein CBR_g924 [Chara braunii]|eukprot:GBG67800.1 hypothetical protein CBR_g924 [Chara braunii]